MENTFLDNLIILNHGLIGAVGALAILIFGWGLALYLARMGTEHREEGIQIMQSSIGLLLTSVVLIWILRFLESLNI